MIFFPFLFSIASDRQTDLSRQSFSFLDLGGGLRFWTFCLALSIAWPTSTQYITSHYGSFPGGLVLSGSRLFSVLSRWVTGGSFGSTYTWGGRIWIYSPLSCLGGFSDLLFLSLIITTYSWMGM